MKINIISLLSKLIRHRGPDWNGVYLNAENHY